MYISSSGLSTFNYNISFSPHNMPVGKIFATIFSILKMRKWKLGARDCSRSTQLLSEQIGMWTQVRWMPKSMQQKNLPYSALHLEDVDINRPGNRGVRWGSSSGALGLTVILLRTFFFWFIHLFTRYFLSIYYMKDWNSALGIF